MRILRNNFVCPKKRMQMRDFEEKQALTYGNHVLLNGQTALTILDGT